MARKPEQIPAAAGALDLDAEAGSEGESPDAAEAGAEGEKPDAVEAGAEGEKPKPKRGPKARNRRRAAEPVDLEPVKRRLMEEALGRQAHTLYPFPEGLDEAACRAAIAELAGEGLAHDRVRPNLTAAGVEAARALGE